MTPPKPKVSPRAPRSGRSERIVAFSCVHAPHHQQWAVEAAAKRIEDLRPDYVVCLGDLFEAASASVHPGEAEHSLLQEYEAAAGVLERLAGAAPKAERIWCLGNHDDNLQARDARRVPKDLRSAIAWGNSKWAPTFASWKQLPYSKGPECVFRVGQALFWHGFDAGHSSDEMETLQMVNAMGGFSWALGVRGHTHRPLPPTQIMRTRQIPLPFFCANAGSLGPTKPEWARRLDTSRWAPGLVVVDALPGNPFRMRGPCWEARTELL